MQLTAHRRSLTLCSGVLAIAAVSALTGCENMDYFSQPLVGEPVCEPAWDGTWAATHETALEFDETQPRVGLTLSQPPDCRGSTVAFELCEPSEEAGEDDECGTFVGTIEFVRLGGRVFANMRHVEADGDPVEGRDIDLVEIREVTESNAAFSLVEGKNLAASIDAGRISGTYREGPHGYIMHVTSGGPELANLVAANPSLFEDYRLLFERVR